MPPPGNNSCGRLLPAAGSVKCVEGQVTGVRSGGVRDAEPFETYL